MPVLPGPVANGLVGRNRSLCRSTIERLNESEEDIVRTESQGWDGICVGEVRSVCHSLVCPSSPCTHAECRTGDPLVNECSPPVTAICARDPFCCFVHWDTICLGEVSSFAGQTCSL